MSPDEQVFRYDVGKATFRLGEIEKRWCLLSISWPMALLGVFSSASVQHVFRFDGTGYPSAPTGRLWNVATNGPPTGDLWPRSKGGRVGAVFRQDWQDGSALYLPCDRVSLVGHEGWHTQFPEQIWVPSKGIVFYLELLHELLNSSDYLPPLRTQS